MELMGLKNINPSLALKVINFSKQRTNDVSPSSVAYSASNMLIGFNLNLFDI